MNKTKHSRIPNSSIKSLDHYSLTKIFNKKEKYILCSAQIPIGCKALYNPVKDYISSNTRESLGKVFKPWTGKSLCFSRNKNINKSES